MLKDKTYKKIHFFNKKCSLTDYFTSDTDFLRTAVL